MGAPFSLCEQKKIILKKNHALVPLSKGKFAKIDREDVKLVGAHSWSYALDHARTIINGKNVRLHLFLMGKRKRCHINFKNGDPLDFRRENLERVTVKFIQQRRGKIKAPTSSRFKGVSWHSTSEKWESYIRKNKVKKYLGSFDSEHEAAKAYNEGALKYFGGHAFLNII